MFDRSSLTAADSGPVVIGASQARLGRPDNEATTRGADWPEAARNRVHDLLAVYDGNTEPLNWNRTPGPMLT